MIEKLLASCLKPILEAEVQLRKRKVVTLTLLIGMLGFLGLFAAAYWADWWSWMAVFGWMIALAIGAAVGLSNATRPPDLRGLARQVEEKHPDLQAALLAAMDQKTPVSGELSFLQKRLLSEISEHAVKNCWVRQVSEKRLLAASWGQFAAVVAFCVSLWFLLGANPISNPPATDSEIAASEGDQRPDLNISVSPGDTEVERGSRVVVEANFSGRAPATAIVTFTTKDGEQRIPMTPGLDETVFSALIPKVENEGTYHISFESDQSRDFNIAVFEFPKLLQADATITPPAYLKEKKKKLLDTRKITVMEGAAVEWKLTLNKPVAVAELFGEDETSISLTPSKEAPHILTATHTPTESQRYRVHLIDNEDRANRRPPWLTVNVKKNVPPELKLTFPGRDFDISAIQEMPFEAEVWDDVSVEKSGLTYQLGDTEESITLTDKKLPGGKKHPITTLVSVESLNAEPRDLISYHFWAEDRDKDGQVRRTTSDMFFAEVRFFEEIVREGQPQQGQGGEQGQSQQLLKLQKEIINASWKLRRDHDLGRAFDTLSSDVSVVHESQLHVTTLLDPIMEKAEDAELIKIYQDAKALMEQAATEFALAVAESDGELIHPAHQTALAVYAKLIEARSRETQISQSKSQDPGQSQQERQRNMNLELKQKELKYEETSSAEEQTQSKEQQENLAVLTRLKELARRQEAIAEKIKELEKQLQDASEEEKEEIERQLKRLQEEQRELLRELDDLGERMDSEQNRPNMAEEREQLDQTRENVQETAENLDEGDLAAAANSATRAQEELEQMEEEFRERTSRRFSEEMRQLRDRSRQLAENQEIISEQLEELTENNPNDPFSPENQEQRGEVARNMSEQLGELEELLEQVRSLSEQAETSEPLLSDALYEAFRNSKTNGIEESLQEARDYTYYNRASQAQTPEQAAARGIEELRDSIDSAAETILGNEADALRLARSELDRLIDETQEEAKRMGQDERTGGDPSQNQSGENQQSSPQGELAENGSPSEAPEEPQPGQSGQPGDPSQEGGQPSPSEDQQAEGRGQMAEADSQGSGQGQQPEEPGEDSEGGGSQPGESPTQQANQSGGQQPGEGEQPGPGQTPGEPSDGLAQGQQPGGKGKGKGQHGQQASPGEGQSQGGPADGQESTPSENPSQRMAQGNSPQRSGGSNFGGDDRGNSLPTGGSLNNQPMFFDRPEEAPQRGPITGDDYGNWADRLSNIEEMLPQEDLRNSVAKVLDDARAMRIDYQRNNAPPESASINQRITNPLVELRQRISEEIAKLNKENPIAPIDRDPVPSEFKDLVRRYYEELGSGR